MSFPAFVFSAVEPTVQKAYRLDRLSDSLVETGEKDLQAVIDSYQETALDRVLDRFLSDGVIPEQYPGDFDCSFLEDKLDLAAAYAENMEEAREAYSLPDSMSYREIEVFLKTKYDEIKKGDSHENQAPQKTESSQVEEDVSPSGEQNQ